MDLCGYVCDFSVDCDVVTLGDVLDIIKYLMKKHNITYQMLISYRTYFTKINTPPWVFFTYFKLCKWYQIAHFTLAIKINLAKQDKYVSYTPQY